MLQIKGLKKHFLVGGTRIPILDIHEWNVHQGEKIAIIGPSGSGKSTLLHLISGIIQAAEGTITVGDKELHNMRESERDRYRREEIGYILQDFHLIPSLTARQNVEIVVSGITGTARRDLVDSWFERVGLQDRMRHLPSQLSRGQQQRVAIIRALINEPALILADEPTGSLDFETAKEMTGLLLELCDSGRHTLIAVTHDLPMADRFPKCIHIGDLNRLVARNPDNKREMVI